MKPALTLTLLGLLGTAHAQGFSISSRVMNSVYGPSYTLINDTAATWSRLSGPVPGVNGSTRAVTVQPLSAGLNEPMCRVPDPLKKTTQTLQGVKYTLTDFGVVANQDRTCQLILPTQGLERVTLNTASGTLTIQAELAGAPLTWYFNPSTRVLALSVQEAASPTNVMPSYTPTPAPAQAAARRASATPTNVAARLDGALKVITGSAGMIDNTKTFALRTTGRTCREGTYEFSYRTWNDGLDDYAAAVKRALDTSREFTLVSSDWERKWVPDLNPTPLSYNPLLWNFVFRERSTGEDLYVGAFVIGDDMFGLHTCRLD